TSARHDVLHKKYAEVYPQTYEPCLKDEVVYIGKHSLKDEIEVAGVKTNIGKLILSPTRTYAPVVRHLLDNYFPVVHGMVHCSGGGQTKCMKYLPGNFRIIKDNLFTPPVIFDIIQKASKSSDYEMYQVFNMGHRLEVFTSENKAADMIAVGKKFGIETQIVGRVEAGDKKELILKGSFGEIVY
ncbi:MAG TPA: AIR synthase-related protein, partial [Segetibacter sp.]